MREQPLHDGGKAAVARLVERRPPKRVAAAGVCAGVEERRDDGLDAVGAGHVQRGPPRVVRAGPALCAQLECRADALELFDEGERGADAGVRVAARVQRRPPVAVLPRHVVNDDALSGNHDVKVRKVVERLRQNRLNDARLARPRRRRPGRLVRLESVAEVQRVERVERRLERRRRARVKVVDAVHVGERHGRERLPEQIRARHKLLELAARRR
mmetsp:Transcript_28727/g.96795  ORF Transcript_28727/g.96795 Transcript_28727/m.96795 type:complete len:214 (-) Transcript_28727:100-741(-)